MIRFSLITCALIIATQLSHVDALDESQHNQLESKLDEVAAHEEIDEWMDQAIKGKYKLFEELDECISGLESQGDYDAFRGAFLDCVDIALKAPPTKKKQISRICKRPGKISRIRFNWLYTDRIEVPCESFRRITIAYSYYLRIERLPKKSADAIKFDRMCKRIETANKSRTSQYKRFISNASEGKKKQ